MLWNGGQGLDAELWGVLGRECRAQGCAGAFDTGKTGNGGGEGPGTLQRTWKLPPSEEEELAAGHRGNAGAKEEVALERFS